MPLTSKYHNNENLLTTDLKNGNEYAFTFLIEKFNHRLCVYADSLINDKDIAQDIVQNVFIKTWEKRNNLKPEFSIKNFLYKSVFNEFIDQNRKRQFVTTLEKKYIEALDYVVHEQDDMLEKLFAFVQTEIKNLPPKCKKVFLMSKQEGLSNIEISNRLDLSIKTIEYHISKAYTIMRTRLDENDAINI